MRTKKEFDNFIEEQIKDALDPSVTVSIVKGDKVIYEGAFGYADVTNEILATPNTRYSIASCTKAFTATAIGILVDRGLMSFDDLLTKHLPEFKMQDEYVLKNLKIKDMLCHRSGLPRHDYAWYANPLPKEDELKRIAYFKPNVSFREKWQYCNYMFMTLGMVVAKVSGKTWEQFVKEEIIDPLKMDNTNYSLIDSVYKQAKGYKEIEGKIEEVEYYDFLIDGKSSLESSGGICSTVHDLLPWMMLNLHEGNYQGKQIVSKESLAEIHTPQMIVSGHLPKKAEFALPTYGFGWFLNSFHGKKMVHHSGSMDGFISWVSLIPEDDIGIAVLSNLDLTKLPERLTYALYEFMFDLPVADWNKYFVELKEKAKLEKDEKVKSFWEKRDINMKPTKELADYAGTYVDEGYGTISIIFENDDLYYGAKRFKPKMKHYQGDEFIIDILDEDYLITFVFDENGNITEFAIPLEKAENAEPIIFKRRN